MTHNQLTAREPKLILKLLLTEYLQCFGRWQICWCSSTIASKPYAWNWVIFKLNILDGWKDVGYKKMLFKISITLPVAIVKHDSTNSCRNGYFSWIPTLIYWRGFSGMVLVILFGLGYWQIKTSNQLLQFHISVRISVDLFWITVTTCQPYFRKPPTDSWLAIWNVSNNNFSNTNRSISHRVK